MTRVLLLGGTTEASALAKRLNSFGIETVFSYAGRTAAPARQPLPTRVGGFGGVAGLVQYLNDDKITHVVDATHPFAAGMSRNACAAASEAGLPLMRLERPPWTPGKGDRWTMCPGINSVTEHLPDQTASVFLAIGKQNLALFASCPRHHYVLRLVDPPDSPLPLPHCTVLTGRGPFTFEDDLALMRDLQVTHVVAKNAGGFASKAKLDAARTLGLPVPMVARPVLPEARTTADIETVLAFLGHDADLGV